MEREYALYAVEQTQQLLAIDSPSGFYRCRRAVGFECFFQFRLFRAHHP